MIDDTSLDLEARLPAWFAAQAPAEVPAGLMARVGRIPRPSPRRRRFLAFRSDAMAERRRLMLLAAAVGVLVILAAGALLAGSFERFVRAGPLSDGVIPSSIPPGVDHGVIDTPLGQARWVHLQGGPTELPDPLWLQPSGGGRVLWFDGWDPATAAVSADLFASRDPIEFPEEPTDGAMSKVGGRYWFTASQSSTLWWSTDLATWRATTLPALAGPLATWTAAPIQVGVRFLIASASLDVPGQVAVLDPDLTTWRVVDLPGDVQMRDPTLVRLQDTTWLFGLDSDDRVLGWRTLDGLTWTGGEPAVLPDGTVIRSGAVGGSSDMVPPQVTAAETGTGPKRIRWASTDGTTWGSYESLGPGRPIKCDRFQIRDGAMPWEISRDGVDWLPVSTISQVISRQNTDAASESGGGCAGDAYAYMTKRTRGTEIRDLWVIEFPSS